MLKINLKYFLMSHGTYIEITQFLREIRCKISFQNCLFISHRMVQLTVRLNAFSYTLSRGEMPRMQTASFSTPPESLAVDWHKLAGNTRQPFISLSRAAVKHVAVLQSPPTNYLFCCLWNTVWVCGHCITQLISGVEKKFKHLFVHRISTLKKQIK